MHKGEQIASLALIESLTAERDALAHRVAALREREQLYGVALTRLCAQPAILPEQLIQCFVALVEGAPDGVVLSTIDGLITYANEAFQAMTGYGPALIGMHLGELVAPEERRFVPAVIQRLVQMGTWQGSRTYLRRDGSTFEANISLVAIADDDGQPRYRAGIIRDLTRQRRLELEQIQLQEQVIEAQRSQLRDVRTPVLRLAPEVVVVPLAGDVDEQRADEIMQALLAGLARQPAATAIIDVSGRPAIDAPVARLLLRAAHALKLLGTGLVVTGVQPDADARLAGLGLEQHGAQLHPRLQDGVNAVLRWAERSNI